MKKQICQLLLLTIFLVSYPSCWPFFHDPEFSPHENVRSEHKRFETESTINSHIKDWATQEEKERQKLKINENSRKEFTNKISKDSSQTYIGWWVYVEGQHIFKDEASLEEWTLIFPNENLQDLENLYLSITEMEYFPMECKMKGVKIKVNLPNKESRLIVSDFEILYIQGCGEEGGGEEYEK